MSEVPISVITTVYNGEKYVKESIQSILNQTFSNFELIILNDGSTDATERIIRTFKDGRIRYIHNRDNKKIPFRRNQGIDLAKGTYIAIHDADDISLPDRLEVQYRLLCQNLDYFCIGGHAEKIDMDGKPCGLMDYPPYTHEEIENTIVKKCMNPVIDPTTMFRKGDFIRLGKYTLDKDIYTVPDFDLWLKAILSGRKLINLQFPLIKYRVNPNGMTGLHKQEMIRAHMVVWRNFMQKFIGRPQRKEDAKA